MTVNGRDVFVRLACIARNSRLTDDVVAREPEVTIVPLQVQRDHAVVSVRRDTVPATEIFCVLLPPGLILPRAPACCVVEVEQHIAIRVERA